MIARVWRFLNTAASARLATFLAGADLRRSRLARFAGACCPGALGLAAGEKRHSAARFLASPIDRVRRHGVTVGLRAHPGLARPLPQTGQGLGMPQPQGACLLAPRLHPPHAPKAAISAIAFRPRSNSRSRRSPKVIQSCADRRQFRLRDQREMHRDELERIAIGVLDLRQGGIERPSERVIQPHERRTGQNFLKPSVWSILNRPLM